MPAVLLRPSGRRQTGPAGRAPFSAPAAAFSNRDSIARKPRKNPRGSRAHRQRYASCALSFVNYVRCPAALFLCNAAFPSAAPRLVLYFSTARRFRRVGPSALPRLTRAPQRSAASASPAARSRHEDALRLRRRRRRGRRAQRRHPDLFRVPRALRQVVRGRGADRARGHLRQQREPEVAAAPMRDARCASLPRCATRALRARACATLRASAPRAAGGDHPRAQRGRPQLVDGREQVRRPDRGRVPRGHGPGRPRAQGPAQGVARGGHRGGHPRAARRRAARVGGLARDQGHGAARQGPGPVRLVLGVRHDLCRRVGARAAHQRLGPDLAV